MASAISPDTPRWTVFEQPLNERVRAFLRLEFLFGQYAHHRAQDSAWDVRTALHTLLDVLSVMGHNDFKTDLVKDLGEQRDVLQQLEDHPNVDSAQLGHILDELDSVISALRATLTSYPGAVLRESELLGSVLNRFAIPGGTCSFDLPSYHCWLSRPHGEILMDLDRWYGHLGALEAAIRTYLKLLRDGTHPQDLATHNGLFMYTPQTHYHLIRVHVLQTLDVYPEISANQYRVSIRFMRLGKVDHRNGQTHDAVAFRLQCCAPSRART
ncbi:MAG: cell division protein ZapD [Nevskiaceae bacterium]|nr:MAG: cell division protein ZapD [Nevskiaceae bacterium]TBR73398.1 MAG: cell division protein ZapD [Nevskiaceae bacterium]